ncbi:hypothetical protein BDN67DRAFT_1015664 [Paxillus ammoniavirescens]|nr:hypothetical protein BDN67DRAFT_1015664 [Paxillus ammoniavirescens]
MSQQSRQQVKKQMSKRHTKQQHAPSARTPNEGPGKGQKEARTMGLGNGAMDYTADGISLVKPTSSQDDVPGTHVNTPSPPPPPITPTMPVEQMAPMPRQPTHQWHRDAHIPRNGTYRTWEDIEGSQREVQLRSRGCRADDKDGDDDDVHHGHVEPQMTQTTCQTAHAEAADPLNPNTTGAGTTKPVGTSYGPPCEMNESRNESNEDSKGEKAERDERASGDVAPSSNSKNTVPDSTPPPPNLDKWRLPLSVPLEGEKIGQKSSGHVNNMATLVASRLSILHNRTRCSVTLCFDLFRLIVWKHLHFKQDPCLNSSQFIAEQPQQLRGGQLQKLKSLVSYTESPVQPQFREISHPGYDDYALCHRRLFSDEDTSQRFLSFRFPAASEPAHAAIQHRDPIQRQSSNLHAHILLFLAALSVVSGLFYHAVSLKRAEIYRSKTESSDSFEIAVSGVPTTLAGRPEDGSHGEYSPGSKATDQPTLDPPHLHGK